MDTNASIRFLAALAATLLGAAHASPAASPEPGADALRELIDAQRGADRPAFHLAIDCTDADGSRALELFESGVGVWGGERQFEAPPETRRKLLTTLADADFPGFAPLYGERTKSEKAKGPLRISCRVALRLNDATKSVAQVADGEPFEPFMTLAGALLDQLEPLGRAGRTAASLSDGLDGLAEGRFAPELLVVRLVRLPGRDDRTAGQIVRIEGGVASRQAYAPGRELTPPEEFELGRDRGAAIAEAIHESGFATWPINLPGDGITEMHIGILGQGHTVSARSYGRIPVGERALEGRALADLATRLIALLDPAAN